MSRLALVQLNVLVPLALLRKVRRALARSVSEVAASCRIHGHRSLGRVEHIRGKTVEKLNKIVGHTSFLDWNIEAPLKQR